MQTVTTQNLQKHFSSKGNFKRKYKNKTIDVNGLGVKSLSEQLPLFLFEPEIFFGNFC